MKVLRSLAIAVAIGAGLGACHANDAQVSVGPGTPDAGGTGSQAGAGASSGNGAAGSAAAGAAGSGTAGSTAQAGAGAGGAAGALADAGLGNDAASPTLDAGQTTGTDPESGRLKGITAAHNVVRANASNPTPSPALLPLTWSTDLAKTAQAYADKLAAACSMSIMHSMTPSLGENLAAGFGAPMTAQGAVNGWAAEKMCWTYGKFGQTDACDMQCASAIFTNGCGHYTQLVWRDTTQVGCGAASCGSGQSLKDFWVCNYSPEGNVIYLPTSRPPY